VTEASRPLRVALFAPAWPPASAMNGIVTYVDLVRAGLAELGHAACVLAPEVAPGGAEDGVVDLSASAYDPSTAERVRLRLRAATRGAPAAFAERTGQRVSRALDALAERAPVDVLEMEESHGACGWVAPRRATPRVVRLHGPWAINGSYYEVPRDRVFAARCRWERAGALAADGLTAPARHILDRAREVWKAPLAHARVIGNPAPVVPPEARWTPAGARPGRILFVGRFDRIKGADILLEAFDRLAARRPEVELVFVGSDDGIDDGTGRRRGLAEHLEATLAPAARARVTLAGVLPPPAIAPLRREAAVTVLASRHEVFPLTALEAMGHASPLVASRIPGVEECAEHERNALLFRPGDARDLARCVATLLDDPARAAELGARAARDAVERFSPRAVAEATADHYREVVARAAGRGRSA